MAKDYQLLTPKNPNERPNVKCKICHKVEEHHAKGMCFNCYRKKGWVREKIVCKSCNRRRHHKAFGLCSGCYVRLHHYEKTLRFNAKRFHGIDYEFYKEVTKQCDCCGFSKIVQIHHLDGNTKNNNRKNVVGLCPNCHRMIHMYQFHEEIKKALRDKGFDVSNTHPTNFIKK